MADDDAKTQSQQKFAPTEEKRKKKGEDLHVDMCLFFTHFVMNK